MKLKLLAATVLVLALGINTTEAQRTSTQKQRVNQGIKNGDLTQAETRRIAVAEKNYHRHVRKAKSDGVVTRKERKELRMYKKHNSRVIFRKKHNRRQSY